MVTQPILQMTLTTSSPEETRGVAECLGRLCRGGEILLLIGDLGSGKTCFVQGLARGLDVAPGIRVTSPTFTIHAEYPGRLILNHLDLYRLDDPVSQDGLGIAEMLGQPGGVAAVEWPEMLADPVAGDRLEIRLEDTGEGRRRLDIAAFGPTHARLIEEAE
jgi:ATPase, YjeE family